MKKTIIAVAVGLALAACSENEADLSSQNEDASPALSEQSLEQEATQPQPTVEVAANDTATLTVVDFEPSKLLSKTPLREGKGPGEVELDVVRAEAEGESLIVQIVADSTSEQVQSFQINPKQVYAATDKQRFVMLAEAVAVDSATQLSEETQAVELRPGEREIVTFRFRAPEEQITRVDLSIPGAELLASIPVEWKQSEPSETEGEATAGQSEDKDGSETTS